MNCYTMNTIKLKKNLNNSPCTTVPCAPCTSPLPAARGAAGEGASSIAGGGEGVVFRAQGGRGRDGAGFRAQGGREWDGAGRGLGGRDSAQPGAGGGT